MCANAAGFGSRPRRCACPLKTWQGRDALVFFLFSSSSSSFSSSSSSSADAFSLFTRKRRREETTEKTRGRDAHDTQGRDALATPDALATVSERIILICGRENTYR
jgi:hypothetical protein